jgi:hypothetical protein
MTKDELEVAVKSANLWAGRSTLILAIGILGEYALLPFLEKKRWHRLAKIFFAVLVVAGIVGEYEFSSQIAQYASDLQIISDHELAGAVATAGKAIDRATNAETHLADANQKSSEAQRDAAQARLDLAKLKLPRSLGPDARRRVTSKVSRFAGKNFAFLVFGDPESFSLLADIDASLKNAKWKRTNTPAGLGGDIGYKTADGQVPSINDIGLKVFAAPDDPASLAAITILAAAITAEGVPCEPHFSDWMKEHSLKDLVIVLIGKKQF